MLLHVLLLLMVAMGLILITLSTTTRNATRVAAVDEKIQIETRMEAAVEMIVHDMIQHGQQSRWLNPPGNQGELSVDGTGIEARVTNVRGLVDINTADPALFEKFLVSWLGEEAGRPAVERLRNLRPRAGSNWGAYADVSVALGLSAEELACLHRDITLFSGLREPDTRYAPDQLRSSLRLHGPEQKRSAISDEAAVYGQTYKLVLSAVGSMIRSSNLVAEIVLTGKADRPYAVRAWAWLPLVGENRPCNMAEGPLVAER